MATHLELVEGEAGGENLGWKRVALHGKVARVGDVVSIRPYTDAPVSADELVRPGPLPSARGKSSRQSGHAHLFEYAKRLRQFQSQKLKSRGL
eukprot:1182301-Prorocentrum_minimum.AAC.5